MRHLLFVLATVLVSLVAVHSQAAIILDFSADGSVTSFDLEVGETIEIPVFLRQPAVLPGEPDLSVGGLLGFGFTGQLDSGIASFSGVSVDPAFDDAGSSVPPGSPALSANLAGANLDPSDDPLNPFPGAVPASTGPSGNFIELGSLSVTGLAAGTTNLSLIDQPFDDFGAFSPPADIIFFDDIVFTTTPAATLNVTGTTATAVPEPGAFALCGLLLGGIALHRRRKSRLGNPQ